MKHPVFRIQTVSRIAFGSVPREGMELTAVIEFEDASALVLGHEGIAPVIESDPEGTVQSACRTEDFLELRFRGDSQWEENRQGQG